jgi:hypothetical protein
MQTTFHILMVRPASFGFNPQTANSNAFQKQADPSPEIRDRAIQEFDKMVETLRKEGVNVIVVEDTPEPVKPDAVFPNNWVTFHAEGVAVLYPMEAENRRLERRMDILENLKKKFQIRDILDLSHHEEKQKYLEGTGSLILDRYNKIAYASLSSRTNTQVLDNFCHLMQYQAVTFFAKDRNGKDIYHTNVVMTLGDKFVVICMDAVTDAFDKEDLLESFKKTRREVIKITHEQMEKFAGNMLSIDNDRGDKLLVMSATSYKALTDSQIKQLLLYAKIVPVEITTIETYGGGSARCMMAEIFLSKI